MSKNTNWKNLGRKQGATMKNFRNMKADKMMYNDGKWSTVYSDDDIKRLAYYNIDLPHVVGIGTNTPFSRLSFGDSSNSGDHVSGKLNPGKLASIALHEKTVQEEDLDIKRGQEFNGIGYVSKLRSVRSNIINTDANGVGIFSNKFISATDSSQKTDKAIMYITDDKHVQIGGVPTGYKLIDRTINGSFISETQETGPNIILDVSGSIHINGFINFLKKGANFPTPTQENDNPANQLTLDVESEPQQIKLCDTSDQTKTSNRAVPEGAIFVGFDKDPNSSTLSTDPRLYIMVGGEQKRIATEDDKEFYEESDSGFNFTGSNGIEGGSIITYVFRNPDDRPGNTLINTFVGITGDDFDGIVGGRNLPKTYDGNTFSSETSALQVLGNISVFDSKYGGTTLTPLNTGNLEKARQILVTEIYDTTSLEDNPGRELGTIYTDRHIMIGGQKYSSGNNPNLTFTHFGSAIDISGGITGKPAIRLISGGNKGSIKVSNPTDSIIIGNTPSVNFKTMNKECILVGENTKYENNVNTLVMGKDNNVTRTKNSLIVGNNLDVSFNNPTEGVVVLGDGDGTDGITVNGDERIVFATNDGNTSKKALIIDKDGRVTISGDLNVEGSHVHIETERLLTKDTEVDLNAKLDPNDSLSQVGATQYDSYTKQGGLKLFLASNSATEVAKFTYDNYNSRARWTTANSSNSVGLAAVGDVGQEQFVVTKEANLKIGDANGVDKFKVTAQDGHVDMSGNLHIHGTGGITLENGNTITNTAANTVVINGEVVAGSGNNSTHSVFKSNGNYNLTLKTGNTAGNNSNIHINGTDTSGDITITASKDIVMNPTSKMVIYQDYSGNTSTGARFDQDANNKVNLYLSGKLTVDGDIDPTGLILEGNPGDYSHDTNKLVLYNSGGTLKYKVGSTEKELAISGGSGTIGGTIEFANDLKITGKNRVVYQSYDNVSNVIPHNAGNTNTYLKTGSANTAPSFAQIAYSEISGDTDDVSEGSTNKYYTDARADARIAAADTDDVSEGSTNLYFTNTRADARIAAADTDDLSEGSTNLYFTNTRADARIAAADTDDLSEGSTNLYFTNTRADARIAAADTDDLSEGSTNLYFTNTRADARADAKITDVLIDEDDMASNSPTKIPSQQSVKAYVDAHPGIVSSSGSSSISGISSKYRLINPQIGQYLDTNSNSNVPLPGEAWKNITSSADGTKLVLTSGDGDIWYSSDSGATWTETATAYNFSLTAICSSSDGSKLMFVVAKAFSTDTKGHAWYSSDSGASWTNQTPNGVGLNMSRNYSDVCCNSDGDKFTAIVNGGYIYTDVGVGTNTTGNGGNQEASQQKWYAIDCSSDGSKLAAVVGGSSSDAGNIWISTDSGDSWTENTHVGGVKDWRDITMSADGTKLAAVVYNGNIWTSTAPFTTWTEDSSVGTNKNWVSITSSDDGTKLTAAEWQGNLWSSTNSGENWFEDYSVGGPRQWFEVTSSQNATKIFGAAAGYNSGMSGDAFFGVIRFDRANYITVSETDQRVGIGTDEPTESLHVNRHMRLGNTTDAENNIYMVSSGQDWQVGTSNNGFYVFDANASSPSQYRIRIEKNGGNMFLKGPIQAATGATLEFYDTIYAHGGTSFSFSTGTHNFANGGFGTLSAAANINISVKAHNGAVWSDNQFGFLCTSDERIKDNITEVPDHLALQMLRNIDCNYYEYKDKISRGTQKTIGFIAQQVKEHFPMAVSIQKDCIPNEMRMLEATWNGLKMSSDLTDVSGVKYKFYVSNDPSGNDEVYKEIIGNADNTFTFDKKYNNVFCYGKEVDDLHTIAKQKLFTLNFSATQEIDKIQQEEKTKLAAAEERISALETENASLKAQLNSIEDRLAALEA